MTLHKRLDIVKKLILEDYPNAAFLHIGPVGSGKTIFLKHLLYERLKDGFTCVYVCVKHSPKMFMWLMKKRNMDVEPYLKNDHLILIDYYSLKTGTPPTYSEYESKILKLKSLDPVEFSVMLNELRTKPMEFVYVDSLSDLFITYGYKNAMKFLNITVPRIRDTCVGAFALDQGIINKRLENYLRSIFDGIVEYKIVDGPNGIERYIRIAHFDLAEIDTRWHKLIIGPYNIEIE
ncbi:MAG: ATPase domain-containing protein [Nitrososphaerota archaeon]